MYTSSPSITLKCGLENSVFSAALRAPIFFSANVSAGLREATGAAIAESVFRVLTAGIYAACTQALRRAEPAWAAALVLTIAMPFSAHVLEFLLHWLRGTHNLRGSMLGSIAFTIFSTLFNWYAMRNGALLVGEEGRTFAHDMLRMPQLIAGFLTYPFRALAAATGNEQLWRLVDGLWIADVGRRLLARRYAAPTWQADDAREHDEILQAVRAGDADVAERLVRRHDEEALRHWSDRQRAAV